MKTAPRGLSGNARHSTAIAAGQLYRRGAPALINDDDFGIPGARTQIVVVRGLTFGQ